jgi:hypothetical protein
MAVRRFTRRGPAVAGTLAAAVGALALAAGAAGSPAVEARTISLNDTAHLRQISAHSYKLYESGQATGTVAGTLYLHLTIASTNHVTAELSIYPRGSSMTGTASGNYRVNGGTASFSGSMSIVRGTGSYSGAHGSGLSFSGTIQRSNKAITVHVSGNLAT